MDSAPVMLLLLNYATKFSFTEDHLKVIYQPNIAQDLLQKLIIAALLELSPCQVPLSCREQFMSRMRSSVILDLLPLE